MHSDLDNELYFENGVGATRIDSSAFGKWAFDHGWLPWDSGWYN